MTAPEISRGASLRRVVDALDAGGFKHQVRHNHVQASCPAHQPDRSPSLSIDYRGDKVVLHCQAGCAVEDVVDALGLTLPDLFDEPRTPAPDTRVSRARSPRPSRHGNRPNQSRRLGGKPKSLRPQPPAPEPVSGWREVAVYDYATAEGEIISQAVRRERRVRCGGQEQTEKTFSQRYLDPATGEWGGKPAEFSPVLYRLPQVFEAIEQRQPVWLAEGEKDADRLVAAGVCATTNAGGAGNFTTEHAAQLTGADVVVVIDRDAAGYRRGATVAGLLAGVARSVRVVLPAVEGAHVDASDHFDAGHSLDEFVPITAVQAHGLWLGCEVNAMLARARAAAEDVDLQLAAAAEARDRGAVKTGQTHTRHAGRWAYETGRELTKALAAAADLAALDQADPDVTARVQQACVQLRQVADQTHIRAGVELRDDVQAALADRADGHGGQLLEHPTIARQPRPSVLLPMSRGQWRYDTGEEGENPRGVYTYLDNRWVHVAPLPYVQARIVRRDGAGRRCGLDYLLAAEPDTPGVIIGHLGLRDGSWANELGLALSDDDKVMKAASTAIRQHAEDAPEREAVPRVDADGQVAIPVPDTLPGGYLATAAGDRADALAGWAQIIGLAAQSPTMALVLGASAVAPYLSALKRQAHLVSLYGDAGNGKTVTLSLAGSIWGDAVDPKGVLQTWNASGIGLGRFLGSLGILPPFYDEAGMSGFSPTDWGRLIFDVCEGGQRLTAENRGTGFRVSKPWSGIFFTAGNGRLTAGLGAGKYAGVGRRVIDLSTPFTASAEHAEALAALIPTVYGHAGVELLHRYRAGDVAGLIDTAAGLLGTPAEGNARTVAKHLHAHVAGAAMLDALAGTGSTLTDAATTAARDYLAQYAAPLHDADRLLDLIRDAIGREPAMWPTVAEYREHRRPWTNPDQRDDDTAPLPQHGLNRSLSGLRADDDTWIAVFAAPWHELCEAAGIDESVALNELAKRGVLVRTAASIRRHEWTTQIKAAGTKLYKIAATAWTDDTTDDDTNPPPAAPDPGDPPGTNHPENADNPTDESGFGSVAGDPVEGCGSVAGPVAGATPALTCTVAGVAGVAGQNLRVPAREDVSLESPADPTARPDPAEPAPEDPDMVTATRANTQPLTDRQPCIVCGEPASQTVYGWPVHLGDCLDACPNLEHTPATDPAPAPASADPQPAAAESVPARSAPAVPAARVGRFAVAVAHPDGVHLPDGTVVDLPELRHYGDAVQLAHDLGLGYRVAGRRHDYGQLWITPALATQLGLPTPDLPADYDERDTQLQKLSADCAWVSDATRAGWIPSPGHLAGWTTVRHRSTGTAARIVLMPYLAEANVRMLDDTTDPGVIARRLQLFADQVHIPFRLFGGATGTDLMLQNKPMRRAGTGSRRIPAVDQFVEPAPPATTPGTEPEMLFVRPLAPDEAEMAYLHVYDRQGHYLAAAGGTELGADVPATHYPDGIDQVSAKQPGYCRITPPEWTDPAQPDPAVMLHRGLTRDLWVATPTVTWLRQAGFDVEILEAWLWPTAGRYLETWYQALRDANRALLDTGSPDALAVRQSLKDMWSQAIGNLASTRQAERRSPIYRPDWRHQVIATAKANMRRLIDRVGEHSGRWPVAINVDALYYTSNDPDPIDAWPGQPSDLDPTRLGKVTPEHSAHLDDQLKRLLAIRPEARAIRRLGESGLLVPVEQWEA